MDGYPNLALLRVEDQLLAELDRRVSLRRKAVTALLTSLATPADTPQKVAQRDAAAQLYEETVLLDPDELAALDALERDAESPLRWRAERRDHVRVVVRALRRAAPSA